MSGNILRKGIGRGKFWILAHLSVFIIVCGHATEYLVELSEMKEYDKSVWPKYINWIAYLLSVIIWYFASARRLYDLGIEYKFECFFSIAKFVMYIAFIACARYLAAPVGFLIVCLSDFQELRVIFLLLAMWYMLIMLGLTMLFYKLFFF